jgi:CheY-like chemotaxis protein
MLGKTKILFVDDEKRFRETWHRLLTSRGYDVTTAENGQIALDSLSKSRVDIIILDLKIPVMSG